MNITKKEFKELIKETLMEILKEGMVDDIKIGEDPIFIRPSYIDFSGGKIRNLGGATFGTGVNLYGVGTSTLRTDKDFLVGDSAYNIRLNETSPIIHFGNRSNIWDVNLYRFGNNTLATSDNFYVAQNLIVKGTYPTNGGAGVGSLSDLSIDVNKDWEGYNITNLGTLEFGSVDVNLYRFVDVLRTDSDLSIGDVNANVVVSSSEQKIWFGDRASVLDTNIYRFSANILRTDDAFQAGNTDYNLYFGRTASSIGFGDRSSQWDAHIKRLGEGSLEVSEMLKIEREGIGPFTALQIGLTGQAVPPFQINIFSVLAWGDGDNLADVNLYRMGVNTLRTDDNMFIGGSLIVYTMKRGVNLLANGDTLDTELGTLPSKVILNARSSIPIEISWNTLGLNGSIIVYHIAGESLEISWMAEV